ncbi:hypothetical protein F4780DRAFT_779144 [Xylariomycetidae sp. FL0641]|nr:hypothetical protein F4780DRAFT_779144 [Xylariomycetidae sp. FL0641]
MKGLRDWYVAYLKNKLLVGTCKPTELHESPSPSLGENSWSLVQTEFAGSAIVFDGGPSSTVGGICLSPGEYAATDHGRPEAGSGLYTVEASDLNTLPALAWPAIDAATTKYRPLEGIQPVDLSRATAGPTIARLAGLLGAMNHCQARRLSRKEDLLAPEHGGHALVRL